VKNLHMGRGTAPLTPMGRVDGPAAQADLTVLTDISPPTARFAIREIERFMGAEVHDPVD
jgi:hypothetical protein